MNLVVAKRSQPKKIKAISVQFAKIMCCLVIDISVLEKELYYKTF